MSKGSIMSNDILNREVLGNGTVLILQRCYGRVFYVYTVPPYIGGAPEYHYKGVSKDDALEAFADQLENDVMEAM
jgi:hypothetical protein